MTVPIIDWPGLTEPELTQVIQSAVAEHDRRATIATAATSITQLQAQYLAARDGTTSMPEWVQPTGAMDAYPSGYQVADGGKTWVSLTDNNTWKPGVSGWREVTAEGAGPAEWVQPSGATDAYAVGAQVTHNGKTWTSQVASNVWEPGVAGWREQPTEGGTPAEWVQPSGATDAYPLGAVVTHNGKTWTSTADNNVWEPGVYGWAAS